jgi:hypothetical protein
MNENTISFCVISVSPRHNSIYLELPLPLPNHHMATPQTNLANSFPLIIWNIVEPACMLE